MFEKSSQHLEHLDERSAQEEHPWQPPAQAKEQSIQRVRTHLMAHFETQHQVGTRPTDRKSEPSSLFTPALWKWLFIGSTAVACFLLVVLNTQQQSVPNHLPVLDTQGHAQLKWMKSAKRTTLNVKTPPNQTARVANNNHWSMQLQGGTQLEINQQSRTKTDVRLRKGFVQTHVVPGIQQKFVIHCPEQVKVVVKGTRFSVRLGETWIRVEVAQGTVQVLRKNQPSMTLSQGKAIRLQLDSLHQQTYSVPVTRRPNSESLFHHLANKHPKQLLRVADDLLTQKEWAKHKRRETLESIAHLLDGRKKYSQASSVWLLIYNMKTTGIEGQTSLFHAAQSCRKTRQHPSHCKTINHRWLQQFPKGLSHLHEEILYWHINSLRKTNKGSQALQQAMISYQQRYPNGTYASQIKKWINP